MMDWADDMAKGVGLSEKEIAAALRTAKIAGVMDVEKYLISLLTSHDMPGTASERVTMRLILAGLVDVLPELADRVAA